MNLISGIETLAMQIVSSCTILGGMKLGYDFQSCLRMEHVLLQTCNNARKPHEGHTTQQRALYFLPEIVHFLLTPLFDEGADGHLAGGQGFPHRIRLPVLFKELVHHELF